MLGHIIIAAVFPAFILAQLPILPCPGLAGSAPTAVRIAGCNSFPCHVDPHLNSPNHEHGFDYEVDFTAHLSSETLTLSVYQTAFGETHKIELTDYLRNGCNGLVGNSCPVQAHAALTHGAHIQVEGDLHDGIPVQMRVEIADDDHICMCALINLIVH